MEKCSMWNSKPGLHYITPDCGGWDIIKVMLLVPEIKVLFVCPSGCGRYGAINAIEAGKKKNIEYLCADEADIISGNYENIIPSAVDEIIGSGEKKPKAMLIFVSCVDDFLGTDYESMLQKLTHTYNIPFRMCRMDPIMLGGKFSPPFVIQKDIYSLLEAGNTKSNTVNLIGAYVPLNKDNELYNFFSEAGIERINHISDFSSFEGFQTMADAKLNIVVRPEGLMAAKFMEKKLGIPFCFLPVSYNISTIDMQYKKLEEVTGSKYDMKDNRENALKKIESARNLLGDIPVLIDSGAVCRPFDTAKALISYGFNVREVYAGAVPEFEKQSLNWLQENAPDIKYYLTDHHSWAEAPKKSDEAKLAIGFDSGYLSGASKIADLAFDEGMFGYGGVISLMGKMINSCNKARGLCKNVVNNGWVV